MTVAVFTVCTADIS